MTPSVGVSSASSTTARSSTSSLSRSTSSSRASSSSAIPVPRSSSSTTWGETSSAPSRRPCCWPSGSTHRCSRPEASPPHCVPPRWRPASPTEISRGECRALARDRRSCVLLLARRSRAAPSDGRLATVAVSADDGAATFELGGSARRFPTTCSHGCAIASRRSAAADDRVTTGGDDPARLASARPMTSGALGQVEDHGLDALVDGRLPREPELEEDRVDHLLDRSLGQERATPRSPRCSFPRPSPAARRARAASAG